MTIHSILKVKQEFWDYKLISYTVFCGFLFSVHFFLIFISGYVLHSEKQPFIPTCISYQPYILWAFFSLNPPIGSKRDRNTYISKAQFRNISLNKGKSKLLQPSMTIRKVKLENLV